MNEYIDLLNEDGKKTGESCLKSEAHKKGLFHASAHIWIFNQHKEVIIQKRAANKDTFPNLWDVSVAGHISAGEHPIISALREVEEEIGLSLLINQLKYIGTSKKKIKHHATLIDNELHHIYICEINFDIQSLKIQKEEVSEIKKISLNTLINSIKDPLNKFVPHGNDYYTFVFNEIKKYNSI
tara:strand:- start:678 stop:1226 length:549 start_codon:yes stop_codon:yes gene_type:complete